MATPTLDTLTQWLDASPAAREEGVQACLERIRRLEPSVHAWVQVRPERTAGDGPLAGIPYGVKDVLETRGLATEYGSPIYKGRLGSTDAALVRELRGRGAILMGKTHCASFAYRTPGPTRNPRNIEHTPGGSSSGSAAAVAAGMVPFSIGTQTLGSILRPASFCGVTGFKPTYGRLPVEGVLPVAHSLDTLGFFTHTPADMLALWEALEQPTGQAEEIVLGAPDPMPDVEPAMAAAFHDALARLREAGLTIRPVAIVDILDDLRQASHTVMFYEGARAHAERYREHGSRMEDMGELVRDGLQIDDAAYDEARRRIADGRARIAERHATTPVILVPAAPGPAPFSLASTGDARMNAPWTALGTPAISLPLSIAGGLPLGLQLTADRGADARVLRAAVRLHAVLHGRPVSGRPHA
ncbi:MAG TPA: amidase [Vicinamibacterales bacterium]|nr:amidase [Vicinamibacterales bacterium]